MNQTISKSIAVYLALMLVLFSFSNILAQEFPERPQPPRLVNDFAEFLQPNEIEALENKLVQFNNETSTQIAVVIVPTLNGYDKASYSFHLAEKWGIGQKGKDNGILILVKPKQHNSKGQVFIATGYGLEAVVPDITAKQIVEREIIPNFKNQNYYQGLNAGTDVLMELTRGEYTAENYNMTPGVGSIIFTFFIIVFIIFLAIVSRIRRARHYSVGHDVSFWTALWLASSATHSSNSSWGSFSSGSGSFGGGFGGFGGGSFGGGGAGGSW